MEAEYLLEAAAGSHLTVRILRMSRSFPEPGDVMAIYRMHRGVDIRDVADAHVAALTNSGPHFQRCIISASTFFTKQDCEALATNAALLIRQRVPALAIEFERRGWALPSSIDRVYDSGQTQRALGWRPHFDFNEVLAQMDRRSLEVLPAGSIIRNKDE